MPKSWTIDQGDDFLQGPNYLPAYVGLLSPLFPAVTLQHAAGDIHVGMPVNCRSFCPRFIFITDLYVSPEIY